MQVHRLRLNVMVDCFYEGGNMLVIHPTECVDYGVCEPEFPADAITPDTDASAVKWPELNAKYWPIWPNIGEKKDVACSIPNRSLRDMHRMRTDLVSRR